MADRLLLLGDEAIAQGALDAGISGAFAYPGTPSTEILEYIQAAPETAERQLSSQWSANEKTALEEALGMVYAGKRALCSMKHVGVNVAADCFMNAAITGVNGGLLIVVADDPSMHSSQNEQDTRFYARFAQIPLFEPASQQEAYDMVFDAFELSERVKLPVVMRITTRMAHSRADIERHDVRTENELNLPTDRRQFVLLPVNARRNYAALIEKQGQLEEFAVVSAYNQLCAGSDTSLGLICCGITWNYLQEVFPSGCPYPVLKIGQYPMPRDLLRELCGQVDEIMVVEEGMPFVEETLTGGLGAPLPVHGRLDGTLPRTGELSPDTLGQALGQEGAGAYELPDLLAPRPPKLCDGCAHAGTYSFIAEALEGYEQPRVFSDIGCYTLGALAPYEAIDTCVDMGASVTMAKGAAEAGVHPAVAVIGDSTFTHSGITGLLDCVIDNANVVIMILDNDITAMTGGQFSLGSGGRLERICEGVGVDPAHIRIVDPLPSKVAENAAILREEIEYRGVSVVIPRRVCLQALRKRKKENK